LSLLSGAAFVLLALTELAWFGGWPAGFHPLVPALAFLAVAAAAFGPGWLASLRAGDLRPRAETLLCLGLAVAYRGQALAHPWGFVNKDGAFGAFIALHLLQGVRPAPIFTEGANYQGSLKGHLAAAFGLITGSPDLAWLMVLASVVLYLVFLAASMAQARRIAGRGAALVTGLYLALSPKFLTTFSLNCVGQYMDVLALGGAALALVARATEESTAPSDPGPAQAGSTWAGIGLLLGAAFWQQPVALAYIGAAVAALVLGRVTRRLAVLGFLLVGLAAGALPVLIWNVQNGWGSGDILGRHPRELLAQAEALPVLVARTATRAFPVLTGLSPGHPAAPWALARAFASAILPLVVLAYVVLQRDRLRESLRGRLSPAALPVLLALVNLALFWATAAGSINARPRYLLPLLAAFAVTLGAVSAWGWSRAPLPTAALLVALLSLNAAGSLPRLQQSASVEAFWRRVVQSLEEKAIRTGYSDFGVAAPVTMFTAEKITLSARLGPTPAYYSDRQEDHVVREGPDAYILPRGDDPEAFGRTLARLGVSCRYAPRPFPTYWACSRRVALDEVIDFRGDTPTALPPDEE
jgi:hypothetical protein